MTTDAVVIERARMKIYRALRHEVIGSRAALPFDPEDPPDVRAWIRQQLASSRSRRYEGTVAYAAHALYLDALTAARQSRRHTVRKQGKAVAMAGLEALAAIADQPPWWAGWPEALEWVAGLVTGAARQIVDAAPHAPVRKAVATLSCLGRTAAAIKNSFGAEISEVFVEHLLQSPDYLALPLRNEHRVSFEHALATLAPGDNLRRALAAARIPWAGAKQWHEFENVTRSVAELRQNGEYQIGDELAA